MATYIRRVSVKRLLEHLLINEVPNKPDRSTQHKQSVQRADLEVLCRLFRGERSGAVEEIAEGSGDGAVDVQDERVLLGGGDGLDTDRVVQRGAATGRI